MISTTIMQIFANLRENASAAASGIVTTCISLVILGSVILVYLNLINLTQMIFQQNHYSIFLQNSLNQEAKRNIVRQIKRIEGVVEIKIISAEVAKKELIQSFGESGAVLKSIELPEFPDIVEFSLERRSELDDEEQTRILSIPGVDQIVSGKETKDQIDIFFTIAEFVGAFLISLMLISIILMIHSSIQVTVRTRIEEIEILKTLGATTRYIRTPFVIEGILIASIGYLVSLGIIYFLFTFVIAGITFNDVTYGVRQYTRFFSIPQILTTLILIVVLGFISSILATNKVFRELKS